MNKLIKKNIDQLKPSATLAINEESLKLKKAGKKIFKFGFGQSPFPIPEKIVLALKQNASQNKYQPMQGMENLREAIYKPLENYQVGRNEITAGTVSPSYLSPIQGLQRLQKIMDEYCGGLTNNYMTNGNLLNKGLEQLAILQEDLEHIGAEDYHQLMRAWELKHRALTSQCVTEHTLFRKETRWPGYYYRGDHMNLDDENWHCLTVSQRDPETGKFTMEKKPVYHIVDEEKKKTA